jgi:protein-S-isoprenylcysteine O-methyltransferase Ste14
MEVPILIAVIGFYIAGSDTINVSAVIVGAFVFHYANRALIYPHRIKVEGKTLPVSMVLTTMLFYTINGYLLGYYFGALRSYSVEWLLDPRFIIGMGLFVFGFIVNVKSDSLLINLRRPGESGYKIPQGGLFRYVSCPNYFGEIVEWVGFAIMSWSLPGVMYALWVSLALLSTGHSTHRWYREQFGQDYPPERKAVIPYVF